MDKTFGEELPGWVPPRAPDFSELEGRYVRLERLEEGHAHALFRANAEDDAIFDYLPYGPIASEVAYIRWAREMAGQADPYFFALRDQATGQLGGVMAYLRVTPASGSSRSKESRDRVIISTTTRSPAAVVLSLPEGPGTRKRNPVRPPRSATAGCNTPPRSLAKSVLTTRAVSWAAPWVRAVWATSEAVRNTANTPTKAPAKMARAVSTSKSVNPDDAASAGSLRPPPGHGPPRRLTVAPPGP